jgi:hypothetical protein
MELTGSVADQSNGAPLVGVTVWEISPDGQSAFVVGITGAGGKYDVNIDNAGSNVNFALDGYTGLSIPASQALASDQVLLQKDGSLSATLKLSGVPSWVWVAVGFVVIFLVGDKKKKK